MGDRQVHAAVAASVEARGTHAPRALYEAYRQFNDEHFGGQLGAPLVLIGACSSPRALGDYCGQDVHGLESRIRISERAVKKGLDYARFVLLHEMIHAWSNEVEGDGERGYRGHGPIFAAKCNEIGVKFGWRTVGVKGRGGLPDCAQWPFSAMEEAKAEDDGESDAGKDAPPSVDARRCLHCGDKPASLPESDPHFCSPKCAGAWMVAKISVISWCGVHRVWIDTSIADACPSCAVSGMQSAAE